MWAIPHLAVVNGRKFGGPQAHHYRAVVNSQRPSGVYVRCLAVVNGEDFGGV